MPGWEAFFHDLAAHIRARRAATCDTPFQVALEVWNEPNLDFQWGYQPVDPARYPEMVRRAYRGAKAADPQSLIGGWTAPTRDGHGTRNERCVFLEARTPRG